jgi:hypothetical protein
MSIEGLPLATELEAADTVPVGDKSDGADRRAPLSLIAKYLQSRTSEALSEQSQYEQPNGSGFAITVAPRVAGANVWLQMAPLAAYAAGTIIIPALSTVNDGQEVLITSTQAVTALTFNGNGANVYGAPSGIAQYGFMRFRFAAIGAAWYRIA